MTWILAVLDASWTMLVLAAPYVLFGLIVAGLMHVLLPESLVLRWMGSPGLAGVVRAALIGVPLPVCSCGVVPITVELRRKGASRPAAQSFLITTPESSVDSIFLTWGMMGPVMAIARPIAAFFTAVIGGVLSIASARSVDELSGEAAQAHDHHDHGDPHDHGESCHHDHGGHHHHSHHHHGHHDHEHTVAFAGSARARRALALALGFGGSKRRADAETNDAETTDTKNIDAESTETEAAAAETDAATTAVATAAEDDTPSLWRDLVQPATRYGFGELLDDLAFWLVVGIGLAGVLTAVLPDDLGALGLGSGILPMLALLVIGIPLYMCASASTPIAAALMLKGVSPGAALVFLLAGPATNAATVLQLAATFGRRFVQIYVVSVAVGAVGAGLLLDAVIGDLDLTESLRSSADAAPGPLMAASAMILSIVLVRSLLRGSWAAGVAELEQAGQRMRRHLPTASWSRRGIVGVALAMLLAAYALTGFHAVPPGARGYGFIFGDLARADLPPGLHYLPPTPFGHWETRHVGYPRKSDVGFRTDLYQIERRRELTRRAPSDEWHSPVAAMNTQPLQASYLTGDGSLVEMSFSVHYTLVDPEAFFYGIEHGRDFVNLYAEAVARELIAGLALDELLTSRRIEVEGRVHDELQKALASRELGIEVVSIRIVDLHPPGAAVRAFRDVSSAKEDRETTIHNARAAQARAVPRSRGAAAKLVAEAEADATRRRHEAEGEGRSFLARAEPVDDHPDVLRHLLWIETLERTLSGREKLIVPPDRGPTTSRGITLWQHAEPSFPSFPEDP